MKQAIVTGATGFIGSAFVKMLTGRGVDVLALGRRDLDELAQHKKQMLSGAQYLKIDMREIGSLIPKLEEIRWAPGEECVFFNLAWGGLTGLSDENIDAQMKNVVWSVDALDLAAEIGCSRFIQVGTMEEAFAEQYLDLDHNEVNKYNRHLFYSVAKLVAKTALEVRATQNEIDFIYVLHSHVMGPGDSKDSFLQVTLEKLIKGEELRFSTGEQTFDVISVEDCALGYFLICTRGHPGAEYWVGSGKPRKLRDYVEEMYRLFPSKQKMQFGKYPYNDVVLSEDVFSIELLSAHTGFVPKWSFEQVVRHLHASLTR